MDACVQALHVHERRSVIPPQPKGKVHLMEVNHTGFTRNAQVTYDQLMEDIDVAADVGVELLMLDAGWFGDVSDKWSEAVGDWHRESPLLEPGVAAVFDRARARGMQVGLWVEAERMGRTSHVLRDHADWQLTKRGESIPNLDLSRPEIARYMEDTIAGLIEKYNLDCYRIDYNITVGEGGEAQRGGYTENVMWRYYDAFYEIFDHLVERFPGILLENCSSGGGRNDLGVLSHFHFTQITDKWAPGPQLKILNGMTMALPPEICEIHVGAINDGVSDVDFMLRIGLFSHFDVTGIFPTMKERHSAARERWLHTIGLYKDFVRPMLSESRIFHHTPIQRQMEVGDWVVLECADAAGTRAYAGIFRLGGAKDDAFHFCPKGLDVSRRYRVTEDNSGRSFEAEGRELANTGLHIAVGGAMTSELLLIEAV
ncbi:MAG: alpha-galactosidase [Anaerolineae bacterium]|nr:alpha-galactosidase [Anaerolineae bacterium]